MSTIKLSDVISPNLVLLDIKVANRHEIVDRLAALIEKTGALRSKESFLNSVSDREKLIPTYMGRGVAIPHGICEDVLQPTAAFARTERFQWNDDAESQVEFVFLLAVPSKGEGRSKHLSILSSIAELCLDDEIRKQWKLAKSPEEILASIEAGLKNLRNN